MSEQLRASALRHFSRWKTDLALDDVVKLRFGTEARRLIHLDATP